LEGDREANEEDEDAVEEDEDDERSETPVLDTKEDEDNSFKAFVDEETELLSLTACCLAISTNVCDLSCLCSLA